MEHSGFLAYNFGRILVHGANVCPPYHKLHAYLEHKHFYVYIDHTLQTVHVLRTDMHAISSYEVLHLPGGHRCNA